MSRDTHSFQPSNNYRNLFPRLIPALKIFPNQTSLLTENFQLGIIYSYKHIILPISDMTRNPTIHNSNWRKLHTRSHSNLYKHKSGSRKHAVRAPISPINYGKRGKKEKKMRHQIINLWNDFKNRKAFYYLWRNCRILGCLWLMSFRCNLRASL